MNQKLFPNNDDTYSHWLICNDCAERIGVGDLTMSVLYDWAKGITNTSTNQLPNSLSGNPLRHSLLIQYADEFLNNNIRKKLGIRFSTFLTDLNESKKRTLPTN